MSHNETDNLSEQVMNAVYKVIEHDRQDDVVVEAVMLAMTGLMQAFARAEQEKAELLAALVECTNRRRP